MSMHDQNGPTKEELIQTIQEWLSRAEYSRVLTVYYFVTNLKPTR